MPTSPFQRGAGEGPEDVASGRSGRSRSSRRLERQNARARYSKARETAQLLGVIPTAPEGAAREERVQVSQQGEQPLPQLVGEAIRRGWAVPEDRKVGLVDELVAILDDPEMSAKVKVAAFNALRQADQAQWERDNPKQAAQLSATLSATTNVAVSVGTAVEFAAAVREMILSGELRNPSSLLPPVESGAPGDSGQQRSVETSTAPAGDNRHTGNGVAHT